MRGRTVQEIALGLDPTLRFVLPLSQFAGMYVIRDAASMVTTACIPGVDNASIYAEYIDLQGHVCIGIAQDIGSPVDHEEWVHDQTMYPILRSYDQVDILGNVIRDTEGDAA